MKMLFRERELTFIINIIASCTNLANTINQAHGIVPIVHIVDITKKVYIREAAL